MIPGVVREMKAKKVKVCPDCNSIVDIENPLEDMYQCSECEEVYEDKDKAKECCKE